ncbi:MaoC family dehydratase N-terminal domain-containing protein [Actinomadura viridis]|uniref:3-methylfumaryl-CoA hydratase n=1 Tax=Actinomadura viridis TaxID=58110 RepID=A0A931DUM3_9ACTN|nr:MaoC family dehydratase N-terminal domain-containing protein [Actinomadura viridis]MBG6093885.1 3-methylfumaryl-CoA hydratase [Actinomadura viridis]
MSTGASGAPGLAAYVRGWRPEELTATATIGPAPAAALAGLLDRAGDAPAAGDPLPPLWQWLYFLDWPAQSELGPDGHPRDGHFLPPVPDRTRMFAGGRLRVAEPLRVGADAVRTSAVTGVKVKEGRTGELLFVTVRHEFRQDGELRVTEEQDLVYRSGGGGAARHEPRRDEPSSAAPWLLPLEADPVLLFRFSALTANAHRIHYDLPYARDEEGYPDLVVHGPLLAVLMAELPRRHAPERRLARLGYRFRRPVFAAEPVLVTGVPGGAAARLSVAGAAGTVRAEAEAEFA